MGQWSSLLFKWRKLTLGTWDIWLASQRRYALCPLNNKISGVCKSKGHIAQQLLLKTRKIYRHCEFCNHAQVSTAEVENICVKPGVHVLCCYWLTEIQSDSRLYGCEKAFVLVLWLKDCLKNASKCKVILRNRNFFDFILGIWDRTLVYSGAKVQSCFYLGDLVIRTGDREIHPVSGRLLDYPGECWHECYCVVIQALGFHCNNYFSWMSTIHPGISADGPYRLIVFLHRSTLLCRDPSPKISP